MLRKAKVRQLALDVRSQRAVADDEQRNAAACHIEVGAALEQLQVILLLLHPAYRHEHEVILRNAELPPDRPRRLALVRLEPRQVDAVVDDGQLLAADGAALDLPFAG